jgi:hypothetical protein
MQCSVSAMTRDGFLDRDEIRCWQWHANWLISSENSHHAKLVNQVER